MYVIIWGMTDAVIAMNAAKAANLKPNGKMAGGRPDKIDAQTVQRANEYVDGAWRRAGVVIPTVDGLSEYVDIARQRIYVSEEFSDTLERLQRIQADMVLQGGLNNEFNPSIAKLILSSKHGYVEKTEVSNTHELVNSEPSQAIAGDFAEFTKQKTQAIEAQSIDKQA